MNTRHLLAAAFLSGMIIVSSCSTLYKAQTPDDVYYSTPRPQNEYVNVQSEKDRNNYKPVEQYTAPDDQYLRWKVRNRARWSMFDDYYAYGFNDYSFRYNPYSYTPWGTYWNNYYTWNSFYNPYCGNVIVVNPKVNTPVYRKITAYTPGTYNNNGYNNRNATTGKFYPGSYRNGSYNNTNNNTSNNSSFGSSLKKIFSNSNNNNNSNSPSNNRPTRTYTPSSSGSSNSGSSGGHSGSSSGSGGVSRPGRG